MDSTWLDDLTAWRQRLDDSLRRPYGWLSLVGLHWLEPGSQRLGRHPTNDIQIGSDRAPDHIGQLVLDNELRFEAAEGVTATLGGELVVHTSLATDLTGEPSALEVGTLQLMVIEREGRLALRVWDSQHPARHVFPGRRWYAPDPSWRVTARFEAAAHGATIIVPNELGTPTEDPLAGWLHLTLKGDSYRLAAIDRADLWFAPFADRTNGGDTYGAGRFLYVEPTTEGEAVVDFNYAYNPPCAFTAFATCPLPPDENRLPLEVRAGERTPAGDCAEARSGTRLDG